MLNTKHSQCKALVCTCHNITDDILRHPEHRNNLTK